MAAFSGKPYPCGPVFRYSTDAPVRLSSMSDGENKNWPNDDESSADFVYLHSERGSSSVGRASASQAEGRGFESRFPLLKPLKRSVLGSKKPYVSTICKAFSFSVGESEST